MSRTTDRDTSHPPDDANRGGRAQNESQRLQTQRNRARLDAARRALEHASQAQLDTILDPREQKVLRTRSGFEDGRIYSFLDIGMEIGVGQERTRQIQMTALTKLLGKPSHK